MLAGRVWQNSCNKLALYSVEAGNEGPDVTGHAQQKEMPAMRRTPGTLALALALGLLCIVSGVSAQQELPDASAASGYRGNSRFPAARSEKRRPGQSAMLMKALTNPKLAEAIGISEEQVKTLKARFLELQEREVALRAELEAKMMRQIELLADPKSEEQEIMRVVEESGAVRTEMAKLQVSRILAARDVLKPEQIEKARTMMMVRAQRAHEGHDVRDGWRHTEGQKFPEGVEQQRFRPDPAAD